MGHQVIEKGGLLPNIISFHTAKQPFHTNVTDWFGYVEEMLYLRGVIWNRKTSDMIKKLIVLSALFIVHVFVHTIIGGMARTIMESATENQGIKEKNLYECQRELITFYDDSLRKENEEVIRFLEQFVHKNQTNDSSGHSEEIIKRNRILTKQTTFQEIFM